MYPKEAITTFGFSNGEPILVSSGDSETYYTILASHISSSPLGLSYLSADANYVMYTKCDTGEDTGYVQNLFETVYSTSATTKAINGLFHSNYEGNLQCTDFFVDNSNGISFFYEVTYLPYAVDDPQYAFMGSVSYGDWLLGTALALFLLSFVTWGYFSSIFKSKKPSYAI